MLEWCHNLQVPEPIFKEYSGGLSITFRFKENIGCHSKSTEKAPTNPLLRQKNIIALLEKSGPLSTKNIYAKLNLDISIRTIKTDLLSLKQAEQLSQIGQGKYTTWQINS